FCFLAEVSPFITILLLLQLVQMSFGAIRTPNISKNKNLSVSHLLTLPYFGGRAANPLMANMEEAASQLIKTGNYLVPAVQRDAVLASVNEGTTLKVKLADLDLERYDDEFSFFTINSAALETLNSAQHALGDRVYGALQQYMGILAEKRITKTRIYFLNPGYVKKVVKKAMVDVEKTIDGDIAVARASWLDNFNLNSIFSASGRNVGIRSAVRGVRRVVAEGDAKKVEQLASVYTPDGILDYLMGNPITDQTFAAGLLNEVNRFYQRKA
ncbi:hypothetical protein HZB02_01590, partial [Candidatus Woesearchaeota archaeon]|nr:hypothetical protein [Candidatus Woesearchaeota archaeon]